MSFVWPAMLWLLLWLPVAVLCYVRLRWHRRQEALRHASLAGLHAALDGGAARRRLPPLLFLLALGLLIVAVARPTAVIMVPLQQRTLILALDISGSMRATDVKPTRLAAAQHAAREFVATLPRGTRVGVVSFAASASLVQPPTQSRDDVAAALDRVQLQRGTAIGSGIVAALAAIFPDADIGVEAHLREQLQQPDTDAAPVRAEPGAYRNAAIVLLSDGHPTSGLDTDDAVHMAAERGVRVYTVGIGTPEGEVVSYDGWAMRVRLDEAMLRSIAERTRGEYFRAASAEDLRAVYDQLEARLVFKRSELEVGALFAAAGALFATLAAALSLWWFNRIL